MSFFVLFYVYYKMCTFNHAFEGQGLMGVMYKIVEGRTPEIPNIYSRELNLFVKKIFRKDPAARPSSSELLREPFIVAHIKGMIERLKANSSKIDDLESTMVIRNDRAEIARAVWVIFIIIWIQTKKSFASESDWIFWSFSFFSF